MLPTERFSIQTHPSTIPLAYRYWTTLKASSPCGSLGVVRLCRKEDPRRGGNSLEM